MEIVILQIETYLFETEEGQFRAMPFYELSIDECIVYENKVPKYLIDFNRRQAPLIKHIGSKMDNGDHLEHIIVNLGRSIGKEWTTRHNILGTDIPGSEQVEETKLFILDDLSEFEKNHLIT
ncbi:hypothetical protein AACH28_09495 [Sphingobacterium thalpophilum]|uniref:Uncharacterized protein n=1 Tax=Sphingobacterium thalpophilum TaxID=259 RepID=A0ACD5C777_9SPHI